MLCQLNTSPTPLWCGGARQDSIALSWTWQLHLAAHQPWPPGWLGAALPAVLRASCPHELCLLLRSVTGRRSSCLALPAAGCSGVVLGYFTQQCRGCCSSRGGFSDAQECGEVITTERRVPRYCLLKIVSVALSLGFLCQVFLLQQLLTVKL